ncbi:unnamed protein product [Gulo gulo]|uniref:Ig-like domain-containing protein n=1 Tax=Gulo gulo TaxID=48420 RepID=A0A9X9PVK8_GULGU|nr:unnamed protein product [Gulo gulo]
MSICVCRFPVPVCAGKPSLSESLVKTSRLTCTLSSGFSVGRYAISWYQQMPRSPPQYLLRFYSVSDKDQCPGVPSCFSGPRDASATAGLLIISGLRSEDEGYY